jgi:hypothetical protein
MVTNEVALTARAIAVEDLAVQGAQSLSADGAPPSVREDTSEGV